MSSNLGAQFQAKFDSNCPTCTLAVYEGDLMGYVDDVAVCDGCYNEAETENWREIRANIRTQQEAERARDPEAYDRRQAAVKAWTDSVKARAAQEGNPEWVPVPGGNTPGWVKNPDHEPPPEETDMTTETIEPGIQALMAAGLLQGQEPGGDGVCNAEIIEPGGKVTEVAIPVPVDPPAAKAPRKSRAKVKPEPEAVPSASSAEDAPAAALARVRSGVNLTQDDVALMPNPNVPTKSGVVVSEAVAMGSPEFQELNGDLGAASAEAAARLAQLATNAAGWDPATIAVEVKADAPAGSLQASLQAAVDSGAMDVITATALGWVDPLGNAPQVTIQPPAPVMSPVIIEAHGPRAAEALEDFKANYESPAADIFIDALAAAKSQPEEDAILAALDNLAPYEGMPGGVEEAKKSILGVIEDAITNHPRSLQKSIGPSEIGTECDHCLAAKLAEWEQIREGGAWLPTVGTAVHTWLEEQAFRRVMLDAFGRPRYLMERKVAVGTINGVEVTGSTDLVDLVRGMTWDWKIVGATTLKSAKAAPSRRYVVQQMLYARGWRRLGINITHVGIAYLPRNDVSLRKAVLWTAEYDESIAVEALARADAMARNLEAMASISAEVRDSYVTGLPRWRSWKENVNGLEKTVYGNATEGQIECLDCARYADYPEDPAVAEKQLAGLLG